MSLATNADQSSGKLSCEVQLSNTSGHSLVGVERRLVDIPKRVLEIEGERGRWDVSILLTTDDHLKALHAQHLSDDTVTDVMAFHYGSDEGIESDTFGEIVISVDRAVDQATEEGWTLERELTFLLIHGLLHLCGWEDETEDLRSAMHERQRDILEVVGAS